MPKRRPAIVGSVTEGAEPARRLESRRRQSAAGAPMAVASASRFWRRGRPKIGHEVATRLAISGAGDHVAIRLSQIVRSSSPSMLTASAIMAVGLRFTCASIQCRNALPSSTQYRLANCRGKSGRGIESARLSCVRKAGNGCMAAAMHPFPGGACRDQAVSGLYLMR